MLKEENGSDNSQCYCEQVMPITKIIWQAIENQLAQSAAAHCRQEGRDGDAENIEFPTQTDVGAVKSEGESSNEIKDVDFEGHTVLTIFISRIALSF